MKKSSFLMFMLSFIPGLSHLYLGMRNRAIVFLLAFFGLIIGSMGLAVLSHDDFFIIILVFGAPIIWLIALIDAFSLRETFYIQPQGEIKQMPQSNLEESNKKLTTMIFAMIPGAGHMYLGLFRKGLIFMSTFFFTLFFMGWLSLSLFLFVLPIIWFYSVFDVFHLLDQENPSDEDFTLLPILKINHKWIGWGLIGIGVLIIIQKMIFPMISWQIQRYIQTTLVAAIFIGGGIKLLRGKENEEIWEEEE